MQRSVSVFQFEQRQQQVFGADVVVAEPKRFAEGQFQSFACRSAERDELGSFGAGWGQVYGGAEGLGVDLL